MRKVVGGNGPGTPDGLAPYAMAGFDFFTEDIGTMLSADATATERLEAAAFTIIKPAKALDTVNDIRKSGDKVKDVGTIGKGNVDDFSKEPFLPDEAYGENLPKFVGPGTKSLNKYDEYGNIKQTKYYDDYGREKGWVDFTNHGYPDNHSVPHWHEVLWNERYPIGGYKIDHRMDTNIPLK